VLREPRVIEDAAQIGVTGFREVALDRLHGQPLAAVVAAGLGGAGALGLSLGLLARGLPPADGSGGAVTGVCGSGCVRLRTANAVAVVAGAAYAERRR